MIRTDEPQRSGVLQSMEGSDSWEPVIPNAFTRMPDITLIVMYNTPVPAGVPQTIQQMYQPVFGQVGLTLLNVVLVWALAKWHEDFGLYFVSYICCICFKLGIWVGYSAIHRATCSTAAGCENITCCW